MKSIFCAAVLLFVWAPSVTADDRVALIIGNSNYKSAARFSKAASDARVIARKFKAIGFDYVALKLDVTSAQMRMALDEFRSRAKQAAQAVVYFAGLGMQIDGENYLLPIDAEMRDAAFGDFKQAIELEALHQAVGEARELRLIILDACRDGPLAGSPMDGLTVDNTINKKRRGVPCLAPIDAPNETLIVSAAKHGTIALDGDKIWSPFARAILAHLATPGLDVGEIFDRVHDTVRFWTNQRQQTVVYGGGEGWRAHIVPYRRR